MVGARLLYKVCTLFLVLLLCACSDTDHPTKEYLNRLNRVLDVEVGASPISYPTFPSPSQLILEPPKYAISIREFLGLRQCTVHTAIAQRNSLIGKVALSSQKLLNDLTIIELLPECIEKDIDAKLKDKLKQYLTVKKDFLPHQLWHAVLAEKEYRSFWAAQLTTKKEIAVPQELTQAMDYLEVNTRHLLKSAKELNRKEFENALKAFKFGTGGQLLSELQIQLAYLSAANKAIELRLSNKLCRSGQVTEKAHYFQNVVNKFFIKTVQARSVLLAQQYNTLMPTIIELENRLMPYALEPFKDWQKQRQRLFDHSLKITKQHALLIQQLYQQCGLVVGNKQTS